MPQTKGFKFCFNTASLNHIACYDISLREERD